MDVLLSGRFWVTTFVSVIITMILIVIVKKTSEKYDIPFLNTLSQNV